MDPTKIEISARITSQSVPEELRFDILGADIEKGKLPGFLKYPHNTTIKMITKKVGGVDEKAEIHFTMEEYIGLVFDALNQEVAQISRGERMTTAQGGDRMWTWRSPTVLCTDLSDLVIYGRTSKATLDKNQAERCNTRTKLRHGGRIGLLRKVDWSDCIDHNQITTVDNVTLKKNLSPFNIESFIEFHQSFLTKVDPTGSNYDPIPMWQAGVQAVALNVHTEDKVIQRLPIQVNNAMFLDTNGSCGYVLKPKRLWTSTETSCIITLKILEGRHLKTLKNPREQLTCPHTEVMMTIMSLRQIF